MIPKIIHQIWIQGSDKIPTHLKQHCQNCQEINSNFKFIMWDENSIKNLLIENFSQAYVDMYDHFQVFAQKADFARYAILYIYGGIYMDMDIICKKNLIPFLNNGFFHTNYPFQILFTRYMNHVIGSRPYHPIFLTIFYNIFANRHLSNNVTKSTGTDLFYHAINQYKKQNPINDIVQIENKYLNPCQMYNSSNCANTCDECYVVHTAESSWSQFNRTFKKIFQTISNIFQKN